MTQRSFAEELENAASHIADVSPADLNALLRRAALRFRNSTGLPLEPDVDNVLASIASSLEMPKAELVSRLITEWLEDNGYLPRTSRLDKSDNCGSRR
jgi:hypothetical protein